MNNELEQLGLSNYEATIYLALLDSGTTGAGELIKRTGLHRNVIYESLNKLIAKHLVVQYVKKKVAQYQVTDPEHLMDSLKAKEELAAQIIPELSRRADVQQEIVVYEGLEGFRTFSLEFIAKMNAGDTYYVLGSVGDSWYDLMGDSLRRFENIRSKKKINVKLVSYQQSAMDIHQSRQSGKRFEIKIVPHGANIPANTLIWNDTIALQTLVEPYSVVAIRNPLLAQAYLSHFMALWKSA